MYTYRNRKGHMYNNMIREYLESISEPEYKAFSCKLVPTHEPDEILGVRVPAIRKYAKSLYKNNREEAEAFLKDLPHKYHEENQLHFFMLESIKDYDECINEIDKFLPYADNWAVTDGHKFKAFKGNEDKVLIKIKEWLKSDHTYTVRFGLVTLMSCFLDELFTEEVNEIAAEVESEEYYVNMMQAWFFATALAKQYESTIPYIEEKRLSDWVHNKTIQKARESYRITPEQKEYLKSLKV